MQLYHIYLAYDFPSDLQDCSLCVAKNSKEAEDFGKEHFEEQLESNPELEVVAYEIKEVDGYEIKLQRSEPNGDNEACISGTV